MTYIAYDAAPNPADPTHLDRYQQWPHPLEASSLGAALEIARGRACDTTHVIVVEQDEDGYETDFASSRV